MRKSKPCPYLLRQNDSPSFKSMCLLIRLGENMRRLLCISPTDSLISPYPLKLDRPLEIMRILRAVQSSGVRVVRVYYLIQYLQYDVLYVIT